jgi:hypothetical protein
MYLVIFKVHALRVTNLLTLGVGAGNSSACCKELHAFQNG